ncbi:ATP-binding protein [Streptomyces sp. NPDC087658]|uniref:ATP-binding protein n=1 Tax=Streptomyces sp. NPDC087658 TaxID=3365800 RepID=UPI003827626C
MSAPLLERLARLRAAVAALVERRRATDPTAEDPLRGLYLSDEAVEHALSTTGNRPHVPYDGNQPHIPYEEPRSAPLTPLTPFTSLDPLHHLGRRLHLTDLDLRFLLIALAPDLDRSFEPLYGYLNDDVGRRRATIGPALDLCGEYVYDAAPRARFHPSAPLVALGLVVVEEPERPFLSRSLRVPDRVVAHLLGDDTPDAVLARTVKPLPVPAAPAAAPDPLIPKLAKRLTAGPVTVYLREHRDGEGLACAVEALGAAGLEALHLTPEPVPDPVPASTPDPAPYPELLREARLTGRAVVVTALPGRPEAMRELVRALAVDDVTVLLAGVRPYDPQWYDGARDPLVLDAPRRRAGDLGAWTEALGASAGEPGPELAPVVAAYRLGGAGIGRVARAALDRADFDGTPLTADHLRLAARQQSTSGLEQHARRIRPDVGWQDLVLPEEPLAHLRELALRARHRDRVLGDWRLSAGGGRGRGVLALFAGDSGTGKTLSAEVVAAELGLDLYVVQLSSIVDKYVGETEKNLERVFTEADRTDAVLLFDEADAVFGKRSEVKDAHDRHANMESAYLLQRLESFDGIALLTTNLRANIDEAFTRRLDLIVDFPFPDAAQRLALWHHSLSHVPHDPTLDPGPCARDFELAGGSIRSAVVTAAYAAAGRGEPVTVTDLLAGARREYRKAGRLVMDDISW